MTVEAMQFTGTNCYECMAFMGLERYIVPDLSPTDSPVVRTLEGDMIASPGDWIIRGVNGEFYPCKPDVFAKTYDPVVEGPSPTAGELERDLDLPPGSINTDPKRYEK